VYLFFKKFYNKFQNQKKKCIIINFIPFSKIDLTNFFSDSYFIPFSDTKKSFFYQKVNKIIKEHEINDVFHLCLDAKYMILLEYLSAKKNKENFDYHNANWGFKYYLRSIINRDKRFPNYLKAFHNPFSDSKEIKIDLNRKNIYSNQMHLLTNINNEKILKQINVLDKKYFDKYFTKEELIIINKQYG